MLVVCRRDCQLCAGSGWHPVTVVRHDRAESAVERCPNVRIIRLGQPRPVPVDGKMLAAEGREQ